MAGKVRTSDAPKPKVAMHLDFSARCPIGRVSLRVKRFTAKAKEHLSSRRSVWLRVFRGDHWHKHEMCVVVAVDKNCGLTCGPRCGASCRVHMHSMPWRLQSDDKTLSFLLLKKVRTIPIVGWTNLQCLQEANARRPQNQNVVTAGQVGSSFLGIQLAKVLGAGTVITAQREIVLFLEWAPCECCGGQP